MFLNLGDVYKLACIGKDSELSNKWKINGKEIEKTLNMMESILSTRLPYENFRGLINFMKVFRPNTTTDNEIEKKMDFILGIITAVFFAILSCPDKPQPSSSQQNQTRI